MSDLSAAISDAVFFDGTLSLPDDSVKCAICGTYTRNYSLVKAPISSVLVCNDCIAELNFVHHVLCGSPALSPVGSVDTRTSVLPDCENSPFFEGSAPVWQAI